MFEECKSDGHCENNCPYFMDCDWIREQWIAIREQMELEKA